MRIPRATALLLAATTLAACGDSTGPTGSAGVRGVVLLNAIGGAKGVTFASDSGTDVHRIEFEPEYDGGAMRFESDTVLTTSSSWGTNKLYVAPVSAATPLEIEMPANSNAAGASLAHGFRGAAAVVALRTTQSIALVGFGGAMPTQLTGAGRCPSDVVVYGGEAWVVDQNAACDGDYSVLGDSRLVRIGTGDLRDTLGLPGVSNAASMIVVGDIGYVASLGVAQYAPDYSSVTFVSPGAVTAVDLRHHTVLGTRALPAGTNGAAMSRGQDGRLYVTAYTNTGFATGVFVVDPTSLALISNSPLPLQKAGGATPQCSVATADQAGHIYCAENQGAGLTTKIYVFDGATGNEIRNFTPGGSGAVDIALR